MLKLSIHIMYKLFISIREDSYSITGCTCDIEYSLENSYIYMQVCSGLEGVLPQFY